jgi:MFS family permease
VLAVVSVSGMTLMGGAFAMNALTANYYPTHIRSTGLGWGLAIGRIGAIIGPIGIGATFAAGWSSHAVFSSISSLGLICAAGVLLLRLATLKLQKSSAVPVKSST